MAADRSGNKAELRSALRHHAETLRRVLGILGAFSSYAGRVTRALVQPSTLTWEERDERVVRAVGGRPTPNDMAATLPSQEADTVLKDWLPESDNRPLLVVGSPGMGKTTLLETFTYTLAGHLIEALRDEDSGETGHLRVPLFIPLRRLSGHYRDPVRNGALHPRRLLALLSELHCCTPALSIEQLECLRNDNLLVFLLDGLDEIQGGEQVQLSRSLNHGERFVVSARPNTGAESHFPQAQRYLLEPLQERHCLRYLKGRFSARPSRLSPPTPEFKIALKRRIGPSLTTPLMLTAWCDYAVTDSPPSRGGVLNRWLRERMFEWLRSKDGRLDWLDAYCVEGENARKALRCSEKLAFYFGKLAICLAENNYEPLTERELPSGDLRFTLADGRQVACDGIELAETAGVLQRIRPRDSRLRMSPHPSSDALAGMYLADIAATQGGREDFVQHFRRLAWVPSAYGILEAAFEELWSGNQAQRELARLCCDWLLAVAKAGPWLKQKASPDQSKEAVSNDLTRPFPLLALRLGVAPEESVPLLVAIRIWTIRHGIRDAVSIVRQMEGRHMSSFLCGVLQAMSTPQNKDVSTRLSKSVIYLAKFVPESGVLRSLKALLQAMALEANRPNFWALAVALWLSVDRLLESSIPQASASIAEAEKDHADKQMREALSWASYLIERRQQQHSREKTISEILDRMRSSRDVQVRVALAWVARHSAERVNRNGALAASIACLRQIGRENNTDVRVILARAVPWATRRVPRQELSSVTEECASALVKAQDSETRAPLWTALFDALARSPGQSSVSNSGKWGAQIAQIIQNAMAPTTNVVEAIDSRLKKLKREKDVHIREALGHAIRIIAQGALDDEAPRLAPVAIEWLSSQKHDSMRSALGDALVAASCRCYRTNAREVCRVLSNALIARILPVTVMPWIQSAFVTATSRLPHDRVLGYVQALYKIGDLKTVIRIVARHPGLAATLHGNRSDNQQPLGIQFLARSNPRLTLDPIPSHELQAAISDEGPDSSQTELPEVAPFSAHHVKSETASSRKIWSVLERAYKKQLGKDEWRSFDRIRKRRRNYWLEQLLALLCTHDPRLIPMRDRAHPRVALEPLQQALENPVVLLAVKRLVFPEGRAEIVPKSKRHIFNCTGCGYIHIPFTDREGPPAKCRVCAHDHFECDIQPKRPLECSDCDSTYNPGIYHEYWRAPEADGNPCPSESCEGNLTLSDGE